MPPCCALCVSSHTSLDNVYKNIKIKINTGGKQAAQCQATTGEANRVFGCIRKGINYKSKEVVLTLSRNLVRPRRECCVQFRNCIDAIEKVLCWATRLIPGRARLSCKERLKETGFYSLERRRLRGDMMEMFKIMKGRDKISADELFNRVDSDRTRAKA